MAGTTVIILPDPSYEVWPNNRRTPCAINLPDNTDLLGYLTSLPYSILELEALGFSGSVQELQSLLGYVEGVALSAEIDGLRLRQPLRNYGEWPPEAVEFFQAEIDGLELREILLGYESEPEGIEMSQAEVTELELKNVLIRYQNADPEGLDFNQAEITGLELL